MSTSLIIDGISIPIEDILRISDFRSRIIYYFSCGKVRREEYSYLDSLVNNAFQPRLYKHPIDTSAGVKISDPFKMFGNPGQVPTIVSNCGVYPLSYTQDPTDIASIVNNFGWCLAAQLRKSSVPLPGTRSIISHVLHWTSRTSSPRLM